ncbi:hypothetical protein QTO30_01335 [Yoonia sp. GPGPB17]|uniref:hypothetical protein n=1 Tax=Yoonia sp. GPGPB17 TaxID=3026147 RepID=UPI0030BE48EE
MRNDLDKLLTTLLDGLKDAEMSEAAKAMQVSKATAYRYRKNPLDMPLRSFVGLVEFLKLPLDLSITLHQEELIEAEELRLRFEQRIAEEGGYRIVTTPHFTVNCEVPEFTEAKFRAEYPKEQWSLIGRYMEVRQARRELYLSGSYQSIEIINGSAYLDFYYQKNLFTDLEDHLWRQQHAEVVETQELPHVQRYIYVRATPELPVILCYSSGDTILRFDDITINLSEDHFLRAKKDPEQLQG